MNYYNILITIITVALITIVFLKKKNMDTFRVFKPKIEVDSDLIITNTIISGKKEFTHPTHNIDLDGKLVSDKICIKRPTSYPAHLSSSTIENHDHPSNCFDYHDFKSIKETPHHYPNSLKIGNTTLYEQDFKNLKNLDEFINQHYFIPSKKQRYHMYPISNMIHATWYTGDRGREDDFGFWNNKNGYDSNGNIQSNTGKAFFLDYIRH